MRGGMGGRLRSGTDEKFNLRDLNKDALNILKSNMQGQLKPLIIAIALTLIISGSHVILPLLTKKAIDQHIVSHHWNGLLLIVGIYVAVALLQWLSSYWQMFLTRKIAYEVISSLRSQVYKHILNLDIDLHNKSKVGDISSVIMNDIETLYNLISQGFIYLISDLVTIITIAITLFLLNKKLTLILAITIPVVMLSTKLIGKLLRKAQREVRKNVAQLTSGIEQNISGVKTVKTFSQEQGQVQKVQELSQRARQANVKSAAISALLFPIMDLSSAIGLALVIWQGGLLYSQGIITLGVLMAAVSYVRRIFGPLMDLSQIYTTYQTAGAALDRVHSFLKLVPKVTYPEHGAKSLNNKDLLIKDLSFGYSETEQVLQNINLSINEGEKIGIIGPSGAGKSTLIKLISKLYNPDSGVIKLGNKDIATLSKISLKQNIQVIPQDTYLFPTTVRKNIAYGMSMLPKNKVVNLVEQLGLTDFFAKLEKGLDTMVGEGGKTLSGGQRQAIAIARAMLRNPSILILDEAASNLDPQIEQTIYNNIHKLWKDKTLILVTHRTTSLKFVEKIFEIKDKGIVPIKKEDVQLAGWTQVSH